MRDEEVESSENATNARVTSSYATQTKAGGEEEAEAEFEEPAAQETEEPDVEDTKETQSELATN